MQLTRREWLIGSGSAVLATCGAMSRMSALADDKAVVTLGGPAFGTYWRATLPSGTKARDVRQAIEEIIAAVDAAMSPYRPETEISQFNATRSLRPIPASQMFYTVVAESLRIAALTGGAFDPTVGPTVNRYGFGPIRGATGARFSDIALQGKGAIAKTKTDATIDLCGIAKGYALDRMGETLAQLGHRAFVLELGGEVLTRSAHPQGRPWRIAIEDPLAGAARARCIVGLDGMALATSGTAANAYTVGGRHYSHIIDPRRSAPTENKLVSVSVIAHRALQADAVATALMVLGPEKGAAFATKHRIPTLMLLRQGAYVREQAIAGFAGYRAST